MKSKQFAKLFLFLFFIVGILDLVAIVMGYTLLETIVKPMIMLSLMAVYFFSTKKMNLWYMLAMAFSFLGDVFLLDKNGMFLYGIAAFLITQLVYIKIIYGRLNLSSKKQKLLAILPFLLFFMVLIGILKENLNDLLIPVVVYGATISVMGMVALLNYLSKKSIENLILLVGASLFILSDSMIALNSFYQPKAFYGFTIMLTYILAQYFIYKYMILSKKD